MGYMGNKRRFKVKKNDVLEIIEKLGLDEVIVDLPDSKETYKILGNFDWDFCDEIDVAEKEAENEIESLDFPDLLCSFNNMATYIEAGWMVAKKSPALIFESDLWKKEMKKMYDEVGNTILTIDHTMISTYLSSYYGHFMTPNDINDRTDIIEDINKKLKEHWKEAQNHASIISFIAILFKK